MKKRRTSKFLSILLLVAMVMSLMPTTVAFAEDTPVSQWTKVDGIEAAAASGEMVAITMTKNNVAYPLPTKAEGGKGQPLASTSGTVSGDILSIAGNAEDFGWYITDNGGTYTIANSSGSELGIINNNNGVRIGVSSAATEWTISDEAHRNLLTAEASDGSRYLGVYFSSNTATDWRCYLDKGFSTLSGQTLNFWVYSGTQTPEPATVEAPTADVASGTMVAAGTVVTFSTTTEAAVISYSTDGGTTWTDGSTYTVNADVTLIVKATLDGVDSDEATFTYTVIPEVVPISTALAGATGTYFTVQGVVTMVEGRNIYVQDETGGICLYFDTAVSDLALGDTVTFTGKRATYKGLPELTGQIYEEGSGLTLTATETTIGALTTDDVCTYVKLTGLTVTAVSGTNITVQDAAGDSIQIYKAVLGDMTLAEDDVINFTGAVGYYNGYQLRNTLATEITLVPANVVPELPEANIAELEPATVQVNGEDVALEAEYKFTPVEPTEEQLAYYASWLADYRVSMDADTAAESFGLYGEYDGYDQHFAEGFLFPQALTANTPVNLLALAEISGVTYNDIVNNIGEFTCGVWNESGDNVGKTFTVELIIWNPDDANAEPAVIAKTTYTFTAPDFPEAKVELVEPPKTDVPLYDISTFTPTGETVDLEAEYVFTPDNPTPEQISYYGNWHADFRISFDDDLAAESFGLAGAYSGYEEDFNVGFLFPQDVTANTPIKLMEMAGYSGSDAITFNDLVYNVQVFDCGVFNKSVDNIGKTITVELIIWDPNDANAEPHVVETTTYTFQGCTLELSSQDTNGNTGIATLTGGDKYFKGTEVTVTAEEKSGYIFVGWYKDSYTGEPVSTSATYTFTITEDLNLVAVYQSAGTGNLHIKGNNYTVDDSGLQVGPNDFEKTIGTAVTLTYTGDDFMYWVNASDNIISTSAEYQFTMVAETTIKLVTSRDLNPGSESVYVVYLNAYKQVLSSGRVMDAEDLEAAAPAAVPSKMGASFEKWVFEGTEDEATEEAILAKRSTDNPVVKIVPKYTTSDEDTFTLTVQVKNGGEATPVEGYIEQQVPAGTPKTIKLSEIAAAAALNEEDFSFWSLDGGETAASYKTEFTVIAVKGQTVVLTAVFGEATEQEPTVTITQMFGTQADNGKYKVSTTMRYFVPEGYTVHEAGFVFTANAANVENLVIEKVDGTNVKKHLSGMTASSAIYTFNANVGTDPNKTAYIRAFVTFTNASGELETIYTDLWQGSYNSLQGD